MHAVHSHEPAAGRKRSPKLLTVAVGAVDELAGFSGDATAVEQAASNFCYPNV
jgi:hypothetical protein